MTVTEDVSPLLPAGQLDRLRAALDGYTVDAVADVLGPAGSAALQRGDLAGARHAAAHDERADRVAVVTRLFVLGEPVETSAARTALAPFGLDDAVAAGLLTVSGDAITAALDIRPYAEAPAVLPGGHSSGPDWWVVSDVGTQYRPGPLPDDHVLGIGTAALTLAQATIREPARRALDIGTGCGVQALHLSRHCGDVVGTDISARALRMAATTAALSGVEWDLRQGSLVEPVAGETFDVIVANPPFVVSPGWAAGTGGLDYRDGGLAGDELCRQLVAAVPGRLAPGGRAQLLANWVVTADEPWTERLRGWLPRHGCDAWVWQREVADPAEYVALWLRDANEDPASARYRERYDAWLSWFEQTGVLGIGMGLITIWHSGRADPVIVCEDVAQPVQQPVGAAIAQWHRRATWLAGLPDSALLGSRLVVAPGVVLTRDHVSSADGWQHTAARLRQLGSMRWELDVDEHIAALLGALPSATPAVAVAVLAATLDVPEETVAEGVVPVLRDLVTRGFLLPEPAA